MPGTAVRKNVSERRIMAALATGDTDRTVARRLGISERTLRRWISELESRTGTRSRFGLAVAAMRRGWI